MGAQWSKKSSSPASSKEEDSSMTASLRGACQWDRCSQSKQNRLATRCRFDQVAGGNGSGRAFTTCLQNPAEVFVQIHPWMNTGDGFDHVWEANPLLPHRRFPYASSAPWHRWANETTLVKAFFVLYQNQKQNSKNPERFDDPA